MSKLKPYNFCKPIEGHINVTLSIPIKSWVPATMEVYEDENNNEYYDEDFCYGIDEVLANADNKNIKTDIELFRRLGWEVEEVSGD